MASPGPGWELRAESSETEPQYDLVKVGGVELEGWVVMLESKGIHFETAYGEGQIFLDYASIESLETEGKFHLFYGNYEQFLGHLRGKEGDLLRLVDQEGNQVLIDPTTIIRGVSEDKYQSSFVTRVRTRYPFWKANLDLGWNLEETAIDEVKISVGFNLERRRAPTRLVGDLRYAFETKGPPDEEPSRTKDELRGFLLGEYDLGGRWYAFVYPAAEWDKIRGVEIRTYPSAGVGYRLVESERGLLQLQAGPGYVYEEFIDYGSNDYPAVHLGAELRYEVWKFLTTGLRVFYMPKIPDPHQDWLSRVELEFTVPITEVFAMKLRFANVSDNNPEPGVGNNKFVSTLGLSLTY